MRAWRLVVLLLLFGAGALALWFGSARHGERNLSATDAEDAQVAYDYEARDVVLRQMGPDGRLLYQIDASHITQLPDSGRMTARELTLRYGSPEVTANGAGRWILTADSGELPTGSGQIAVHKLTVHYDPPGTAIGGPHRWILTADRGELPADGSKIILTGNVRAHGVPVGDNQVRLSVVTEQLRYDRVSQELDIDVPVQIDWGTLSSQSSGARVNMRTGIYGLGSGNATASP